MPAQFGIFPNPTGKRSYYDRGPASGGHAPTPRASAPPMIPSFAQQRNQFSENLRQQRATTNAQRNGVIPQTAPPMNAAAGMPPRVPVSRGPRAASPAPGVSPSKLPVGIAAPTYDAAQWDQWMKIRKEGVAAAEQAPWIPSKDKPDITANPAIGQAQRDYADAATQQSSAFAVAPQSSGPQYMPAPGIAPPVGVAAPQSPQAPPSTQPPGMTGRTQEQRDFESGYAERERERANREEGLPLNHVRNRADLDKANVPPGMQPSQGRVINESLEFTGQMMAPPPIRTLTPGVQGNPGMAGRWETGQGQVFTDANGQRVGDVNGPPVPMMAPVPVMRPQEHYGYEAAPQPAPPMTQGIPTAPPGYFQARPVQNDMTSRQGWSPGQGTAPPAIQPPQPAQAAPQPQQQAGPRQVRNAAEYAALPPGTPYIDPNGVQRTKR